MSDRLLPSSPSPVPVGTGPCLAHPPMGQNLDNLPGWVPHLHHGPPLRMLRDCKLLNQPQAARLPRQVASPCHPHGWGSTPVPSHPSGSYPDPWPSLAPAESHCLGCPLPWHVPRAAGTLVPREADMWNSSICSQPGGWPFDVRPAEGFASKNASGPIYYRF